MADITKMEAYFNSQPHKEADYCWGTVAVVRTDISTHSLTRRLTGVFMSINLGPYAFQLTASQGG